MSGLYIGLMSGTSVDGIDAALVEFESGKIRLIGHHQSPHQTQLRQNILELCRSGSNEIERMGALDRQLGEAFAEAVTQLLQQRQVPASRVTAIGSHGQTIRHRPPSTTNTPFTLQIGDPNIIAELTGITTVADFRRRDMAAGGEGAPLVPAFHRAVFSDSSEARTIVNIGGMANLSHLPIDKTRCAGFDTGPGNVLLDAWIERHRGLTYDRDGQWARKGHCNQTLLQQLLAHPFLHQAPPKSTGREVFQLNWLDQQLTQHTTSGIAPEDVQATLLELTAMSISQAIKQYATPCDALYICGGGAHNGRLMERLAHHSQREVKSSAALGIAPQWVEATAFAWLAQQTIERRPGNDPATTGAHKHVILGGIYLA